MHSIDHENSKLEFRWISSCLRVNARNYVMDPLNALLLLDENNLVISVSAVNKETSVPLGACPPNQPPGRSNHMRQHTTAKLSVDRPK